MTGDGSDPWAKYEKRKDKVEDKYQKRQDKLERKVGKRVDKADRKDEKRGDRAERKVEKRVSKVERKFGPGTDLDDLDGLERKQLPPINAPILGSKARRALATTSYYRRVMTDLDDTMHCSAAKIFAGIDTDCDNSGEIYPGVAQFQLELSLGPDISIGGCSPPRVVPLSARPKQLKKLLAIKDSSDEYDYYRKVGEANGVVNWGLDVLNAQYGSIGSAKTVAKRRYDDKLPGLKYQGWKTVGPQGGFHSVFCGDNGQGDVRAAQMMMSHKHNAPGSKPCLGAFIHHVQPLSIDSPDLKTSLGSTNSGTRALLASQGIYLHRNYGHAACIAYKQGYISREGYTRVMENIVQGCMMARGQAKNWGYKVPSLCKVMKPELTFHAANADSKNDAMWDSDLKMFGWFTPRDADSCDVVERVGHRFDAGAIFSSGGYWTVGFCRDIDAAKLSLMTISSTRVGTDFESSGLNPYVYWAMKAGLHCFSDCKNPSCSDMVSQNPVLAASKWSLTSTGAKDWSGMCSVRSNIVCRVHL